MFYSTMSPQFEIAFLKNFVVYSVMVCMVNFQSYRGTARQEIIRKLF